MREISARSESVAILGSYPLSTRIAFDFAVMLYPELKGVDITTLPRERDGLVDFGDQGDIPVVGNFEALRISLPVGMSDLFFWAKVTDARKMLSDPKNKSPLGKKYRDAIADELAAISRARSTARQPRG